MKLGTILLITILVLGIAAGIGVFLFNQVLETRNKPDLPPEPRGETPEIKEIYIGLRQQALQLTPSDLGSKAASDEAYAVVMDWNIGAGVVTLVASETGDASMYFSSGAGVIGGIQHDHIRKAASKFVANAKKFSRDVFFDEALPADEQVKFHFIQSSGIRTMTTNLQELEAESSPLTQYFDEANNLIAELRTTARENDEHR